MKKLLLFLFIAVMPLTSSFAQTDAEKLSPENEKRIVEMSRAMANELMLNEPEFIKLKALNREKIRSEDKALAAFKNAPAQYEARMLEIDAEFEAKLMEFLTPTQKKAFAMHKESQNSGMIVITTEE